MNRFNGYMNNHFSACRLLARARDECRGREVGIHQIPGHWDVVGITDGTDAWIAPTSAGSFFKTASGDVADIMRRLQAGEDPGPVPAAAKRGRVALDDDEPKPRPAKAASARVRIEDDEQPQPRTRRHALID